MKVHNLFLQTAHTAPPDLLGLISVLLQNSGLVDIRRGLINMRIASVRFEHILVTPNYIPGHHRLLADLHPFTRGGQSS